MDYGVFCFVGSLIKPCPTSMAIALPSSVSLSWSDEIADPFDLPNHTDESDPYCMPPGRRLHFSNGGDEQQPFASGTAALATRKILPEGDEEEDGYEQDGGHNANAGVEDDEEGDDDDDDDDTSGDVLMMSNPPATAHALDTSPGSDDVELLTLPLKIPMITFAPPLALKAASTDLEGSINLDASTNHLLTARFAAAVNLRATEKREKKATAAPVNVVSYDTPSDDTMRGVAMVQVDSDDSMADSRLNFSVQALLPEAPAGVEEMEAGHIRKRQRVNPSAYLTIVAALAITAACVLLQLDIFPTSAVFGYAKLALSPFSTIFGALMTYLFNDMHGFHVDFSSSDGYFIVKRFTAVTWPCFGAKVREFPAKELLSVKIVHPCGSPDKAALVFETTRGHFAAGRQPRFCRCSVAELEEEARFWVYIASSHGAKCQFSGVQVNKILPPMY
jgi:hypothetical protein